MRSLLAALMLVGGVVACGTTHHNITLTLIRHAQSTANAAHIVDTTIPGPDITPTGVHQAQAIAHRMASNHYDGIFASNMVRTQETAQPMSRMLNEQVTPLSGLREIEAGTSEGQPESSAPYSTKPVMEAWIKDRSVRIPGSALDGYGFQARFSAAVRTIYDTGERDPVAFSHGEAIAYWVRLTARHAYLADSPLPNTGVVVLVGNPYDGWTLLDWDGNR